MENAKEDEMETDFFKGKQDEEENKSEEIKDSDMGNMRLKVPKPMYDKPTLCKVKDARFFKMQNPEPDKKGSEYIGFSATITYVEVANTNIEFSETYRGGRIYTKEGGATQYYIGAKSALGRLKAVCLANTLEIGPTVKTWAAALKDKTVMLKSEPVMFQGQRYDKNYVVSINNKS